MSVSLIKECYLIKRHTHEKRMKNALGQNLEPFFWGRAAYDNSDGEE